MKRGSPGAVAILTPMHSTNVRRPAEPNAMPLAQDPSADSGPGSGPNPDAVPSCRQPLAERWLRVWHAWERTAWRGAIAWMAVVAVAWLTYQTWRYFSVPTQLGEKAVSLGAIDLHNRFDEVRSWFRGEFVYAMYADAVYPPASYALLRFVFNVLPWVIVKPLWYFLSLVSVGILGRTLVEHSLAESPTEKTFLGLMPFAFYATGAAVGNGQLVVFVLPLVVSAILLLSRPDSPERGIGRGSLLMLFALVQPTIAAPFFWLVIFLSPRLKPAIVVVALYLTMTALAVPFQIGATVPKTPKQPPAAVAASGPGATSSVDPWTPEDRQRYFKRVAHDGSVLTIWSKRATQAAGIGSVRGGYASAHDILAAFGLSALNLPVSLAILIVLGGWVFRHRRGDLWLLLAVTAIVARMWTYHRWYDDLLLVFPLIALFRTTKLPTSSPRTQVVAASLFFWVWLFLLAPGVLYTLPHPEILVGVQVGGWIAALVFLLLEARRARLAIDRGTPSSGSGIAGPT